MIRRLDDSEACPHPLNTLTSEGSKNRDISESGQNLMDASESDHISIRAIRRVVLVLVLVVQIQMSWG